MKLSKKSLQLLAQLFSNKSNLQLPVGLLTEIIEIRNWIEEELKSEVNKEDLEPKE